jgi:hypothetical protein
MAVSAIIATGPMTAPAIQALEEDEGAGVGVDVLVSLAVEEEFEDGDAAFSQY